MSFSFFGCWNSGYCRENPFSYVSDHIKKNDSDIVIVAGDNYYPEKSKDKTKTKTKTKGNKSKTFDERNFDSGFNCLVDINKPTYILMGNHDIQYEKTLLDSDGKNLDMCHIIGRQLGEMSKKNLSFKERYLLTDNELILFLNTSLYTSDKDEMLNCFQMYKEGINQPSEEDIDSFIIEEYNFFTDIIGNHLDKDKLIIVGHHPIVSVRDKKKIECLSHDGLILLDELYALFEMKEKFYLCADVHQYQTGVVTINDNKIVQHVVGTGGTALDDVKCKELGEHTVYASGNMSISYNMEYCDNKHHGYLLYDGSKFKFIQVNTNPDTGYSSMVKSSYRSVATTRKSKKSRVRTSPFHKDMTYMRPSKKSPIIKTKKSFRRQNTMRSNN